MVSIKQSLNHSAAAAKKLSITVPSSIQRGKLRCAEAGDVYAQKIYGSNGNYAILAAAFTKIANICDKALNNKTYVSSDIKKELQQAKKKALAQASCCKKRMAEIKEFYNLSADIDIEVQKYANSYVKNK